ncbi:heterokaryon incompatibility protein-domain-containing protein [Fusarium tricinctum]|uniref:Heterokaryon incompatibility protein-domain-containing protein n=1 Tax=Fusarium tricinctum TaxID=61284 RepID=A0A8K0RVN3_9HYPO|nr:heterokaryon incompatibility protein-domain-containing protein [Fusarium tricinctum]
MKRERSCLSDEQPNTRLRAESLSNHLCSRCCAIRWSSLTQKPDNDQQAEEFDATINESHEELRLSSCEVCQLFALLKPTALDSSTCSLRAVSLSALFTNRNTLKHPLGSDTNLVFIVSGRNDPQPDRRRHMGHVIAVEPLPKASTSHESPRYEYDKINFDLIKEWMEYCDKNHPKNCKPEKLATIPNLKVIDCTEPEYINLEEPKVISAPAHCKYAALSYVWGDAENKFPRVVKDSIKVVSELKCGYLWVDRYCINQDKKDPNTQEQIQRMDEIYSQALFTIIDAAGTDCNSGLAGVTHPRQSDPVLRYAEVNGAKLTYLGTPPAEKIRSSRWSSRGWTYQEGVLSHKRIFFTNEQVMFQCNNMTCIESFNIPMSILHRLDIPNTKKEPVLKDTEPLFLPRKGIGRHLMEFSKRNLTFDSDTLNAFLGILNAFRRNENYFHLHGNPIHENKGCMINAWHHVEPGARNANFPSWSWTGCKGAIKMTSHNNPDYEIRVFRKAESEAGCSISVDDYRMECSTTPLLEMKPIIQLKGKMTNLSFELFKWGSEINIPNRTVIETPMQDGTWAILPLTTDITCYSFLYLDNEALTGIYQFRLPVMVLEFGERSRDQNVIILVLKEKGDRFERVGMITLRATSKSTNEDNETPAKLTMYRDKSGRWMKRAPTTMPQDPIWQKELEKKTIVLQ